MGKRKYSAAQEAKLTQLRQVHAAKMQFQANIRAEIEARIASESRDWELRESRLMNESRALGITQTDVSLAVGTTNWYALKEKYALTESEFVVKQAEQFVIDSLTSSVLLRWFEFSDGTRVEGEERVSIMANGYTAWPFVEPLGVIGDDVKSRILSGSETGKEATDFVERVWREANQ